MNILAIIPARGGSKGIPFKNLVLLRGKPLIRYTLEAAAGSVLINKIVVSSDNTKILAAARSFKQVIPLKRPRELARDDTPALPVIRHAVTVMQEDYQYSPDFIVLLQPTSPLRTSKHIDEALTVLTSSKADSLVSIMEVPHQFNPCSVMQLRDNYLVPYKKFKEAENLRQKKPKFFARNGAAIYAFTKNCLINKNSIYGDSILPYYMSVEESVDIDTPLDLKWCEFLMSMENRN